MSAQVWRQRRQAAKAEREAAWTNAKAKAVASGTEVVTPDIVQDRAARRNRERDKAANVKRQPDKSSGFPAPTTQPAATPRQQAQREPACTLSPSGLVLTKMVDAREHMTDLDVLLAELPPAVNTPRTHPAAGANTKCQAGSGNDLRASATELTPSAALQPQSEAALPASSSGVMPSGRTIAFDSSAPAAWDILHAQLPPAIHTPRQPFVQAETQEPPWTGDGHGVYRKKQRGVGSGTPAQVVRKDLPQAKPAPAKREAPPTLQFSLRAPHVTFMISSMPRSDVQPSGEVILDCSSFLERTASTSPRTLAVTPNL